MDEREFGELTERHRRELHVHCYRMLGSFADAEDVLQETFLRAWRRLDTFDGTHFRAWLYKIATNACLDAIRRDRRVVASLDDGPEVSWLEPYPDRLLDAAEQEPGAIVIARETIELAFLTAVQHLPPRQRAVLVLRDVLGWTAQESAETLDMSVASANSALQRARATLRERLPTRRADWSVADAGAEERALLEQFIAANDAVDTAAMAAVLCADIRVTMPPAPYLFAGLDAVQTLLERAYGPDAPGIWRMVPTAANRLPAAASYLQEPGDDGFRAFKLDVLRVVDGRIAEITTFGPAQFPRLGLPDVLPA